MRWRRKAQAGAAVLVALIAILIILYVLFLPPAERDALLGETPTTPGGGGGTPTPQEEVLVQTVPSISEDSGPEITTLPPFSVRTKTAGNVLAEQSGLTVERSVFHNEEAEMTFMTPTNTENVYLSFSVLEASGNLQISLNDELIYDSAIRQNQPPPILLQQSALQSTNTLTFSTSGVGFAFWNTNQYRLSNVKVTGDVTTFEEAAQTQRFVIQDLDSVERVFLHMIVDCYEQSGRLLIDLNAQTIYSGFPPCGQPLTIELAPQRLTEGENTLSWNVDAGQYLMDSVAIETLRAESNEAITFQVSQELFNQIARNNEDILLRLSFRNPGSEGVVEINGEALAFRTFQQRFAGPITPYIQVGTNTIELTESSNGVTLLEVLYG